MLQQQSMIERTRRVCQEDERLVAAMMYGDEISRAYLATWEWGRELMAAVADGYDAAPPEALLERLDGRFARIFVRIRRERS